jgi:hypothetical protein
LTIIDPPWGINKGPWDTLESSKRWRNISVLTSLLSRIKESVTNENQQAVVCFFGPPEMFYQAFSTACSQVMGFSTPTTLVWVKSENSFDKRPGIHHDVEFIHMTYYSPLQKPLIMYKSESISRKFEYPTKRKTKKPNSSGGNSSEAFNKYIFLLFCFSFIFERDLIFIHFLR